LYCAYRAAFDGKRVVVYPNDHRPAHVHVIGGGGEAVFDLHCPDGPPELREVFGFGRSEVGKIRDGLVVHISAFCNSWRTIHGDT
jgi:hypothetical protein